MRAYLALVLIACGSGDEGGDKAQVQQGEYLVEHVLACGLCHTPTTTEGALDVSKRLSGVKNRVQPVPGTFVSAPNLTPDATGLGSWTDAEIKRAVREGINKKGELMWPRMPYWEAANLTETDLDAVIAYLRSLPAVANDLSADRPAYTARTTPVKPITGDLVPQTTMATTDAKYAMTQRGRYLASIACMSCHTQEAASGDYAKDTGKLFAGNYKFSVNLPYTPAVMYSMNLTPHENGIAGHTAEQIQAVLKSDGSALCAPMRFVQKNFFVGMTDADALALGTFVTTLAPVDTGVVPVCTP